MEFEDEMAVDENLDLEEGEIDEPSEPLKEPSIDEERKLLRAKRFGTSSSAPTSSDPEVAAFHAKMGVDSNTRTEALHLLGTEAMKTDDVFAYFQGDTPASIEWISDNSCNIFWLDEIACAKSFISNTVAIRGQPGMIEDSEENPNEESINFKDVRVALPSGIWRKGKMFSLAPNLYIRYARFSDKKSSRKFKTYNPELQGRSKVFLDEGDETGKKLVAGSGNPWVDIARQWSYYEHKSTVKKAMFEPIPILPIRDARELISSKKTKPEEKRESHSDRSGSEEREEIPIGRMHADLEQERMERRHRNPRTIDLRDKLSRKRKAGTRSPVRIDEEIRLGLRMAQDKRRQERYRESSPSETESLHSEEDLRKTKLRRPSSQCKRKLKRQQKEIIRSPLRIEIDNDIYFDDN